VSPAAMSTFNMPASHSNVVTHALAPKQQL
jgi:hypothetical protein